MHPLQSFLKLHTLMMQKQYQILLGKGIGFLMLFSWNIFLLMTGFNNFFQMVHKILHKDNFSKLIDMVCCHFISIEDTVLPQTK